MFRVKCVIIRTLKMVCFSYQSDFTSSLNEEDEDDEQLTEGEEGERELYRISDASGSLQFQKEKTGDVSESDLDTKVGVWVQIGA